MKILYILHSTIMGGATISFLNMVQGLRDKGYIIVVVIPDDRNGLSERLNNISVRSITCPVVMSVVDSAAWGRMSTKKRIRQVITIFRHKYISFFQLLRILKREKPDLVHTNVGVVHEGYWASRVLGIPHIWHLREYQDSDFSWKVFPSKVMFCHLLKKSNVISITKDIHRHFGLKEDLEHIVIYNGVLSKRQTSLSFPKQNCFLCASRISREKGQEDAIRAFSIFLKTHPRYKLIILGFGDTKYINYLKSLCVDLHIEDSVVFPGFTSDVIPHMVSARGLVVASYSEGFGRMTAEAAFCGCLVIGRNTGGTKEILEETGGFVFETQEELVEKMCMLADLDQNEYVKRATFSREKAVNLYSVEQNTDAVEGFYRRIYGLEENNA